MKLDDPEFRCKNCIYWRKLYIHPWSKDIPEELKGKWNGFACTLFINPEFMKNDPETFVDAMIGSEDSCGCECFTEKIELSEDDSDIMKALKEMRMTARNLKGFIDFRHATLDWSEGMNGPILRLWRTLPYWSRRIVDYGEDWFGWDSTENYVAVIDVSKLPVQFINKLGRDFDYDKCLLQGGIY